MLAALVGTRVRIVAREIGSAGALGPALAGLGALVAAAASASAVALGAAVFAALGHWSLASAELLVVAACVLLGWVASVLGSVRVTYDLYANQRDYLLLDVAPVAQRTVLLLRLAETWVRVASIPALLLVAVCIGWALLGGASVALVATGVVVAVLATVSACCGGALLALVLLGALGRTRFEQLLGSFSWLVIGAAVLLMPPHVLGTAAPASPSQIEAWSVAVSPILASPWLPSTWAASGLIAVQRGSFASAASPLASFAIVCVSAGAFFLFGIARIRGVVAASDVAPGALQGGPLAGVSRALSRRLGVVGIVAFDELRRVWRDAEHRVRLLMLPIVLPVYLVKLPQLIGDSPAPALSNEPMGLVFGLFAGVLASSWMALRALNGPGACGDLLRTAPVSSRSVVLGKFLGAYVLFEVAAVTAFAIGTLAVRQPLVALGASAASIVVGGAALVALGVLAGAAFPGWSSVDAGSPRPPFLASACYLASQAIVLVGVFLAVSSGHAIWAAAACALAAGSALAASARFAEVRA